ncbi:MAG: GntR family transcriptional regulator [Gemmatimonadaceae bacterium]
MTSSRPVRARRPRTRRAPPPASQSLPDSRPTQVYEQLRTLIVGGQIAPGTRLVEVDIAARLDVSRTPVRAALQRLQQEGYVLLSPGLQQARPVVAPLTKEDARELFHVVGELEALAAERAARLTAAVRRALVADLRALNQQLGEEGEKTRPDHALLQDLDERFHERYVAVGAGPRLSGLHAAVKPQAQRYERLYISMLGSQIGTSVREHNTIVRAIRAGEPEAAHQAVRTNWRNAAERLATAIARAGERGAW